MAQCLMNSPAACLRKEIEMWIALGIGGILAIVTFWVAVGTILKNVCKAAGTQYSGFDEVIILMCGMMATVVAFVCCYIMLYQIAEGVSRASI